MAKGHWWGNGWHVPQRRAELPKQSYNNLSTLSGDTELPLGEWRKRGRTSQVSSLPAVVSSIPWAAMLVSCMEVECVSMLTIDQLSHYLWRSLSIYSMHRESAAQTGHPLRSFPRPSNSFPSVNGFPREGIERVNWLLSELCFFFEGEGIRLHYKGFLKIVLEKCYGSFETCLSWVNVSSV